MPTTAVAGTVLQEDEKTLIIQVGDGQMQVTTRPMTETTH